METIQVMCFVTPKGEVFWFESSRGPEYAKKVVDSWKKRNKELLGKGLNINTAIAQINMLKSAFDSIPATNDIKWPSSK